MEDSPFLSAIDKEASSQEEVILNKTKDECGRIMGEAKKEAERLEKGFVHHTDLEIRKLRSRFQTQQNLESRLDFLGLKSRFVTEALEGARTEFDALKKTREYETILKKFLSEMLKYLDGKVKKAVLRVNPEDEKVGRTLLQELRLEAKLVTDTAVTRGLEIEEEERALRMRNTFDSRLRTAHEAVIQHLNEVLFKDTGR